MYMYVNMCFILIATQTPRSPLETATSSGKTERLTMWLQNTEAEELGAWPRWAKMDQDGLGPPWLQYVRNRNCKVIRDMNNSEESLTTMKNDEQQASLKKNSEIAIYAHLL